MFDKKKNEKNEKPYETTAIETEVKKKKRKVKSQISDSIIKVTVIMGDGVDPSTMDFDTSKLGQEMKDVLTNYGASTRLVASSGGREGKGAVDAITAAWGELVDGSWAPRKPAVKKFSEADIETEIQGLAPNQREVGRMILAKLVKTS